MDKYQWSNAFFRFEEFYFGGYSHETIALTLTYGEDQFRVALEDIRSQPGFSEEIQFEQGDFSFRLNDTERLCRNPDGRGSCYTDYSLEGDAPYLRWINLCGWPDSRREIAFVGLYHEEKKRTGFWEFETSVYPFEGWAKLFDAEFPYYNWG